MPRNSSSSLFNILSFVWKADPSKPVLMAGDPERAHEKKVKDEGGITYHINQVKDSVSKVWVA